MKFTSVIFLSYRWPLFIDFFRKAAPSSSQTLRLQSHNTNSSRLSIGVSEHVPAKPVWENKQPLHSIKEDKMNNGHRSSNTPDGYFGNRTPQKQTNILHHKSPIDDSYRSRSDHLEDTDSKYSGHTLPYKSPTSKEAQYSQNSEYTLNLSERDNDDIIGSYDYSGTFLSLSQYKEYKALTSLLTLFIVI